MWRAAEHALAAYQWREGWDLKYGKYSPIGGHASVSQYADIPCDVIHGIMCKMYDFAPKAE